MIGGFDHVQCSWRAKLAADGTQKRKIGQRVACALKEKHGHGDFFQVLCPLCSRLIGRMQGKAEEDDAAHIGERRSGSGGRSHASTEGLATGNER